MEINMATHVEESRKRKAGKHTGEPPEKKAPSVTSEAPRGINVLEFAEARALELHNMIEEISRADKRGSKRVFQSLPKHMRRRAASYNTKRIPVRLREFDKKEDNNQADTPKKKKFRRQRRRAKSLLNDYNRRKENNIWLETHIWHAKRMKMVNVWGYKLAEHPSDKSFRACHRALSNTCLLQDISYYCCIEVKGYKCDILSAMGKITRKELGPTIASVEHTNTGKEGHVMLYHPNQYPYAAIGPASFIWRQFVVNGSNNYSQGQLSQLWIWTHPSCFDESLKVIEKVCEDVSKGEQSESTVSCDEGDQTKCPKKDSIVATALQFDLVRLRLTGPLAHSLLVNMLQVTGERNGLAKREDQEQSSFLDANGESNNNLKDPTRNNAEQESGIKAEDIWETLKSVSCSSVLKPSCTIGLTVLDPRLGLPGKRTSIDGSAVVEREMTESKEKRSSQSPLINWPPGVASSTLWDSNERHRVKETKMDDHQLNKLRSNLLLPSTQLELGAKASHVPILLIQQPGKEGYGAGWDIILPAGWTMPFWIALVYRGARVGGLRESRNCSLESEAPHFPRDFPDTQAGRLYNKKIQNDGETKHSRYPPNKRPNYEKLGIRSPFSSPWATLVKEWSVETEKRFFVESSTSFRDGEYGSMLLINEQTSISHVTTTIKTESRSNHNKCVQNDSLPKNSVDFSDGKNESSDSDNFYVLRDISVLRDLCDMCKVNNSKKKLTGFVSKNINLNRLFNITKNNFNALVPVSLRMANQGSPMSNSTLSIPASSDLKEFEKCTRFGGPTEPLHKGPRGQFTSKTSNANALVGCCTRDVIGYVTSGQYSLSRGYGVGIGYCALPGLARLLSTVGQGIVLVRNTSSQQYRLAFLSIISCT